MKAVAVFLLFAAVAIAEDKPVKNPLTPKEITDGWLLLFDGESSFGLSADKKPTIADGKISIQNGEEIKIDGSFPLPYQLVARGTQDQLASNILGLLRIHSGRLNTLGFDKQISTITASCRISDDMFKMSFVKKNDNGVSVEGNSYSTPASMKTRIWLEARKDEKGSIEAIKIKAEKLESIFNGKDLSGWKVFTGDVKKNISKWEVTKEGEIHLSNGPGDLQTEKQYKDFLVQLECKTNGPSLNSGLFFRCLENQYQQGYECQIQNGFKDGDRTKPADFGTGAIYRRVPARTVVSNDHEWFTMTVLAVGPHIRTWVNGYPVVSWTDDRKPAENARNGQYLKAGHLSLQGHDKTTDILFRNIRIVEIK